MAARLSSVIAHGTQKISAAFRIDQFLPPRSLARLGVSVPLTPAPHLSLLVPPQNSRLTSTLAAP